MGAGEDNEFFVWTNSLVSHEGRAVAGGRPPGLTYQDVQAGGLEQSDLVGNAEPRKAGQPLGKLHDLDDALGGQLAELVPEPQIQLHPVVCAGVLQGGQVGTQAKARPGRCLLSAETPSSPSALLPFLVLGTRP